jgi:integrase
MRKDSKSNPTLFAQKIAQVEKKFLHSALSENEIKRFSLSTIASECGLNGHDFSYLQAIDRVCKAELADLSGFYSRTGLPSEVTKYRRVLIQNFGQNHASIHLFKVNHAVLKGNSNSYKEKIDGGDVRYQSLENPFPATSIDSFVNRAIQLTEEKSFIKNVIGLCALTGRRPIEIMLTAGFSPCENETHAIFTGQAKIKRDSIFHKTSEESRDNYEIPLLCGFEVVKKGLDTLRSKKDFSKIAIEKESGKTLEQAIHDQQSGELNKCVKREFGRFFTRPITPYDMRGLYVAIQLYKHGLNTVSNEADSFISQILGHKKGDLLTQRSYKKFTIVDQAVAVEKTAVVAVENVEKVEKTAAVEKVEKQRVADRPVLTLPKLIKPIRGN